MILPGDAPQSIIAAAQTIRAGGLLGLPTETVYGLAADADNDAAVTQIFKAKGRPADHPLIVHVGDASVVAHYASEVPEFAQRLMAAFWPGPLTVILPRRSGVASVSAGGNPTIGLRCPSHPVAQALLLRLSCELEVPGRKVWGLAAPSANQFGRVSPTTATHVQGEFGEELLILDGGPCDVGIESTIIDCSRGVPVLLRPGVLTLEQAQAVCRLKVLVKDELQADSPKASGTLESHYAPHATVRLMTAKELQMALNLLGSDAAQPSIGPRIALYCRSVFAIKTPHVKFRRMPNDAAAAAQELFAVLRGFDKQGVKLIWIETPPEESAWDGVRDRLERAAS